MVMEWLVDAMPGDTDSPVSSIMIINSTTSFSIRQTRLKSSACWIGNGDHRGPPSRLRELSRVLVEPNDPAPWKSVGMMATDVPGMISRAEQMALYSKITGRRWIILIFIFVSAYFGLQPYVSKFTIGIITARPGSAVQGVY